MEDTYSNSLYYYNQKKTHFWRRVKGKFDEARSARSGPNRKVTIRKIGMLTNRWGRIDVGVMKWVDHYEQAIRRNLSGIRKEDVINEAKSLHGPAVATFETQCQKLRNYPRWRDVCTSTVGNTVEEPHTPSSDGSAKRSRDNEDDNCTPTERVHLGSVL